MSETWSPEWGSRLRELVQGMGYQDVYDFVMDRAGQSFGELFGLVRSRMGGAKAPVAFVQLPEQFFADANVRGRLRDAIIESLVRSLRQFCAPGWNVGQKARERRIVARSHWPIPSFSYDKYREIRDRVWKELESRVPSDDWCPLSQADPVIQQVFDLVWPMDEAT